jgi:hypothetical protein
MYQCMKIMVFQVAAMVGKDVLRECLPNPEGRCHLPRSALVSASALSADPPARALWVAWCEALRFRVWSGVPIPVTDGDTVQDRRK